MLISFENNSHFFKSYNEYIYFLKKENKLHHLNKCEGFINKLVSSSKDVSHLFSLLYLLFDFKTIVNLFENVIDEQYLDDKSLEYYIKSLDALNGREFIVNKFSKSGMSLKFRTELIFPGSFEFNTFEIVFLCFFNLKRKFSTERNIQPIEKSKILQDFFSSSDVHEFQPKEVRFFLTQFFIQSPLLINDFITKFKEIKDLNVDFNYVGTTGIGNSILIPAYLSLFKYEDVYKEVRSVILSLLLDERLNSSIREMFYINRKYKSVLIVSQQGVGDEIRNLGFLHYINAVNLSIVMDPRFVPLINQTNLGYNIIPFKQSRPGFYNNPDSASLLDRVMSNDIINSLNHYDLVMTSTEYLYALKSQVVDPQRKLLRLGFNNRIKKTCNNKKRIGIIWRSDFVNKKRERHFINLSFFEPLFSNFDAEFVPLVNNLTEDEVDILKRYDISNKVEFINTYDDFVENSKLLNTLDLVVGISSFDLELASAMGKPAYILCPTADGFYTRSGIDAELGKLNVDYMTIGAKTISSNNYRQSRKNVRVELINNLLNVLKNENFQKY